jgi:hypothetical protein
MQQLINYTSYVIGKRVIVDVSMTESGGLGYDFISNEELSANDRILLQEEATRQARAALNSKILLG